MKVYMLKAEHKDGSVSMLGSGLRETKSPKGWGSVGSFKNAIRNVEYSWRNGWFRDFYKKKYKSITIVIVDLDNETFETVDALDWYYENMGEKK